MSDPVHCCSVLMTGPVGAQVGGMASVVRNLEQSRFCRLAVLDTGKNTTDGRSFLRGVLAQIVLLGRLVRMMRNNETEILHIHTCSGFTFWRDCLHFITGRVMGRRVVWHIHGGKFGQFLDGNQGWRRALARWALSSADAVVVLSDQWKYSLVPYAPEARWSVIHNGVSVPSETRAKSEGPTTFLFLGNLGSGKGVLDLVEATRRLLETGEDCRVLIAGNETEGGEVERLLTTVQQNGLSSHIDYLGVISGSAKDETMRSADVIVLPSYAEGLPMALLEGMAYGLAVLSTNVGGIPELVSEGRDGILIEPGDIDALARAMHKLSADKLLAEHMGRAARQKIINEYSMPAMTSKLSQLYLSFGH